MIAIEMKDEPDAKALFHRFLSLPETRGLHVKLEQNCVTAAFANGSEGISRVASVLTEHVIDQEEEPLLLDIITSTFYFQDVDEQEQILAIAKSIIQGKKPDLPGLDRVSPREQLIFDAFSDLLDEGASFHYDSFIRFRLGAYRECLERYVEMAIDEYKMEQEYQNFVESLRTLLKKRRPLIDTVHLVFNREFAVYDRQYRRIDETAVRQHLDPEFRQSWGMDMEPSVLVTLIGIAPKMIFLYTDSVDAGMIQTIQNVFQERLVICPARSCHFHS